MQQKAPEDRFSQNRQNAERRRLKLCIQCGVKAVSTTLCEKHRQARNERVRINRIGKVPRRAY